MKSQNSDNQSMPARTEETHPDMTPDEIGGFIAANRWIFAKTAIGNPHEYCLRKHAVPDEHAFERLVMTIRRQGYRQKYGGRYYMVLDFGEHFMWSMGAPLEQTVLINRKSITAKPDESESGR